MMGEVSWELKKKTIVGLLVFNPLWIEQSCENLAMDAAGRVIFSRTALFLHNFSNFLNDVAHNTTY